MTHKIFLLLLGFLAVAFLPSFAQQEVCGFDHLNRRLRKNPAYVQRVNQMENKIQEKVQAIQRQRSLFQNLNVLPGPIYEIPVVVHVIYKAGESNIGSASNPSDAQIEGAIDFLNSNFATAGTPIRFALAKRKQDCTGTSGIERIDGGSISGYNANGVAMSGIPGTTGADETAIKSLSFWPVRTYYNIWVVWNIDANLTGGGYITGYATLPYSDQGDYHAFPEEGTVIRSNFMSNTSMTLTHEMGHAFGLYHTFEGGDNSTCPSNNDCTADGDKVCDTDPVKSLLGEPCFTDNDLNECFGNAQYGGIQRNIMGYGSCRDLFTAGQANRMLATLEAVRSGLANSTATLAPPTSLILPNTTQVPQNIINPDSTYNMGPCNITIGNLSYYSNGYNQDGYVYYLDHSCNLGTVLQSSQAATLTVTTSSNPQRCKAWIDFNNNGHFDANEIILNSVSAANEFTHTGTVTTFQMQGAEKNKLLRMRVMADWYANDFGPGSQLEDGQTEDFWISITGSLPVVFSEVAASFRNNQLFINWNTESETNNDHFLVQGSLDGKNFVTLAQYTSKAQNGNADSSLQYKVVIDPNTSGVVLSVGVFAILISLFSFRNRKKGLIAAAVITVGLFLACNKNEATLPDTQGSNNVQYIRIAQVDKNGTVAYSKVVRVVTE